MVLPEGYDPSRSSLSDQSPRFIKTSCTTSAGEQIVWVLNQVRTGDTRSTILGVSTTL